MSDTTRARLAGIIGATSAASVYDILQANNDLDFRQRSNLLELERHLHSQWNLGRNLILAWSRYEQGALLLVVPHYAVAEYAVTACAPEAPESAGNRDFIMRLMSGPRLFSLRQMGHAARLLAAEPTYVVLRHALGESAPETAAIERMIERYAVSYVASRAVALFDIVGFSLASPFEQMTQLNSLSYSLNSAHSKMLSRGIRNDFARSSTGDGFYVWNREVGLQADIALYHYMQLVLADNAVARGKARGGNVPRLRLCFHVGSCYEFPRAEGLNPTVTHDIVGEVSIDLARMIDCALAGQILVGDFRMPGAVDGRELDALRFVREAQRNLDELSGLELSGESIESIKCYLTGRRCGNGHYSVRKLAINDKHGLSRTVFNAKVNIYRRAADPIFLGVEDRLLGAAEAPLTTCAHLFPRRHDDDAGGLFRLPTH